MYVWIPSFIYGIHTQIYNTRQFGIVARINWYHSLLSTWWYQCNWEKLVYIYYSMDSPTFIPPFYQDSAMKDKDFSNYSHLNDEMRQEVLRLQPTNEDCLDSMTKMTLNVNQYYYSSFQREEYLPQCISLEIWYNWLVIAGDSLLLEKGKCLGKTFVMHVVDNDVITMLIDLILITSRCHYGCKKRYTPDLNTKKQKVTPCSMLCTAKVRFNYLKDEKGQKGLIKVNSKPSDYLHTCGLSTVTQRIAIQKSGWLQPDIDGMKQVICLMRDTYLVNRALQSYLRKSVHSFTDITDQWLRNFCNNIRIFSDRTIDT